MNYKLQRTWRNLMVQIKWCWFHSKMFIFGQGMAKNSVLANIWSYVVWTDWTETFYGSTGEHYLSIGDEKPELWCLFFIFWDTFDGKMGVATTRTPNGSGSPNPTKKLIRWVDLLGHSLSRNHVFEIFRGEAPSPS